MENLRARVDSGGKSGDPDTADLENQLGWLDLASRLDGIGFGMDTEEDPKRMAEPATGPDLLGRTRTVLRYMLSHGAIEILDRAIRARKKLDSLWYAHKGIHVFQELARPGMAVISSQVGDRELRQYCSFNYFSDRKLHNKESGSPGPHNRGVDHPFFRPQSEISCTLTSFLLVTGVRDKVIFASPICMILDSRQEILL
jgi:hypothetical protein